MKQEQMWQAKTTTAGFVQTGFSYYVYLTVKNYKTLLATNTNRFLTELLQEAMFLFLDVVDRQCV